ncbi:WD repeat domain phosphoinositide-interacting protein 2-like isoform X2 [Watersipora subatra]|uniref:WD repeat domain phosphoinositide-interacting protein 2-like isoform X2 n=1 Tax=Watersipora subatra TaxID=2589382 RepID=UPI00355B60C0
MSSVSFNQDSSSLAFCTGQGYHLFTSKNVQSGTLERLHFDDSVQHVQIAERLFTSNLVALVDRENPCSLRLCHFLKGSEICRYSYPSNILSVRLNQRRLIVCLVDQYCIHDIRNMVQQHVIHDSVCNPKGLCALSVASETALIGYPGSDQQGVLIVFDALLMAQTLELDAHNSPLAAIAFSQKADLIATASTKGTVIRTFSTDTGDKLHELRRGMKRCVSISCLAFSQDGVFLAASSNTETVHIFNLFHKLEKPSTEGWVDYLSSAVTASAASLIPATISTALNALRAFATARLSTEGNKTVTAIVSVKGLPYIVVADENGLVHIFKLNAEEGGECELLSTKRLESPGCDEELEGQELERQVTDTDKEDAGTQIINLNDSQEFPPMSS